MKKARIFIDKKDYMVCKSEVFDARDKPVVTMRFENVKRGVKFSEDLFKYTPPEGVQVMDMEEAFRAAREAGGAKSE